METTNVVKKRQFYISLYHTFSRFDSGFYSVLHNYRSNFKEYTLPMNACYQELSYGLEAEIGETTFVFPTLHRILVVFV